MKLAFVTPRYGSDVFGGAEMGARMLAEHLAALDGWSVEALTTCARDAWTWANEYEPGTTVENGVTVHRFANAKERDADFRRLTLHLLARPEKVSEADGYDWIDKQGPIAPDLIDAIRASDHDLLAFTPYLYHPTVVGLPLVRDRAVLHPAAHDEPAIRLPLFDDVFEAARGLAFYTEGERAIAEERFPSTVAKPQVVVGLGIDAAPATTAPHGVRALESRPYLLCLGRVDHSKGTHLLASLFARYKERNPGPLALAVVGPVQRPVPVHPDIVEVGEVDDATKWALLRGATLLDLAVCLRVVLARALRVVGGGCARARERTGAARPSSTSCARAEGSRSTATRCSRPSSTGCWSTIGCASRWPRRAPGMPSSTDGPQSSTATAGSPSDSHLRCPPMSDVEPGDGDLERDLAEQWQRVQQRGSYSAALSAPLDAVAERAHFRIPEVPASSKVPGGGTIHTVVGKTVTRHLTDLCAQLDDFAAVGPSCSGGDRRRARRPGPARGAEPPRRRRRPARVAAARAQRAARIGVTEQRERVPLVWIGSLGPGGGAERVIAAFDLVCTYDDPSAELVMAGPAPDPRHLAKLVRYRDELKLFGLRFHPDPSPAERAALRDLGPAWPAD